MVELFRAEKVPEHLCGQLPGTPSGIKLLKNCDGLFLCWDPPEKEKPLGYALYMAIYDSMQEEEDKTGLIYICLYEGPERRFKITRDQVLVAHLDKKNYSFQFLLATVTKQGYGPAILVSWVQGTKQKIKRHTITEKQELTPASSVGSESKQTNLAETLQDEEGKVTKRECKRRKI